MHFNYRLFKPLINNLNNNDYDDYKFDISYGIKLPKLKPDLPFIFSCFALSIDGKLCYPDNKSGFTIAKFNQNATDTEKYADWWTLNLARSISDAIIIGTNSLKLEHGEYIPVITETILKQSRVINNLHQIPTTIVMCRDLNNINFDDLVLKSDEYPVIILCDQINHDIPHSFIINTTDNIQNISNKQILINNGYNLNQIFKKLYQLGFKRILNESPYYHHQLLKEQLLDEFWLNYSLVYIGGNITTLGQNQDSFTSHNHPEFKLLLLEHIDSNFLFTRQKVIY